MAAMRNLDSQIADSSYSSISEPPDIRNWFSSYTYQSPVLDTNEEFGKPLKVDEEERGLCVEDSEDEEENGEDFIKARKTRQSGIRDGSTHSIIRKCTEGARRQGHPPAVEVPAPDSLSLPSEPPDIRNWFSSYVYESPALNSAEFDVSLSTGYDSGNIEEVDIQKDETLKEVNDQYEPSICMEAISNSYATSKTSIGVKNKNHSASQERDDLEGSNLSPKINFCPERTSGQSTQDAAPRTRNIITDKSDEYPRVEVEDPLPILQEGQQRLPTGRLDDLTSPAKTSYGREYFETGEVKSENKIVVPGNDSGWILPNKKTREVGCKSIKGNSQYMGMKNGYTLLKKKASRKINDENSSEELRSRKGKYESNASSVSSTSTRKDGVVTREALKEKTNFQHSYADEVAGKWRCPQRSKPDTGPPLKQLRLEKWVHRI